LDHTIHFRLLFHDRGRFPDDCSTEASSHRLKSVWGLRNSFFISRSHFLDHEVGMSICSPICQRIFE
jgi:hypothetical protein